MPLNTTFSDQLEVETVEQSSGFARRQLSRRDINQMKVVAGLPPRFMLRLLGMWGVVVLVTLCSILAFSLTQVVTIALLALVVSVTVAFLLLGRITEGWPSVVVDGDKIGIVYNPFKREYLMLPLDVIESVEPDIGERAQKLVKINLQALSIDMSEQKVLAGFGRKAEGLSVWAPTFNRSRHQVIHTVMNHCHNYTRL